MSECSLVSFSCCFSRRVDPAKQNCSRVFSFFLADVVLLELVDPYLVLDADHPVLRVNGFVHEINANGTVSSAMFLKEAFI